MATLKKTNEGFNYYGEIPESFRLATMDDYLKDRFKHNTAFLIKSYENEVYYTHRVKHVVTSRIIKFIELERVYIYEG